MLTPIEVRLDSHLGYCDGIIRPAAHPPARSHLLSPRSSRVISTSTSNWTKQRGDSCTETMRAWQPCPRSQYRAPRLRRCGGRRNGGIPEAQLGGPYRRHAGLYVSAPIEPGAKNQGSQSASGPAQHYRHAFDKACKAHHAGKGFAELAVTEQDACSQALKARRSDSIASTEKASSSGHQRYPDWILR